MREHVYFCECEDQHEDPDDQNELVSGCITYPAVVTDEHSASSYGQPVVVIDGEARGPADMPPGELQLPVAIHGELAPRLRSLGYLVCESPVNEDWLERWEQGKEIVHWHPEARLVQF